MRPFTILFPLATGCATDLESKLQKTFDEMQQQDTFDESGVLQFPGGSLSVVLADGETIDLVTGYEDFDAQTPFSPDLRLASGSTGKLIAGALATLLVVDGSLDPREPIARWFAHEEWFSRLPNGNALTVEHLLQHTTGLTTFVSDPAFAELTKSLYDPASPDYAPDTYPSFETLMSFVLDHEPLFAPGEELGYSDNGYLLLGAIIGKVLLGDDLAGEDAFRDAYYQGAQERILDPLALSDTTPLMGRIHPGLAQGYVGEHPGIPDGIDRMLVDGELIADPTFEFSGGGFVTTPHDLAVLARELAHGSLVEDGEERGQFVDLLHAAGPTDDEGGHHGYGPYLAETSLGAVLGHGGEFPGYQSCTYHLEDHDLTVAIQVNSWQNHRVFDYVGAIATEVLEH